MAKREITPIEILRQTRRVVARPHAWIKGSLARTKEGWASDTRSPDARKFCLLGALDRASFELADAVNYRARLRSPEMYQAVGEAEHVLQKTVEAEIGTVSLTAFNDFPSTKRADVLRMLNKAINDLEMGNA